MNIAIVTGASSGLGRAFVAEWEKQQLIFDEVWIIARKETPLQKMAAILPWKTRCLALDLSKEEARDELYGLLREKNPQVKVLVNSAGFGLVGEASKIGAREQAQMVRLNCEALTEITQATLPYMGNGSMIYEIASVAAFLPQPQFAVYAATKAFVLSYSRALNAELKQQGIGVLAVCPNPMDTQFFARAGQRPSGIKTLFFEKPERVVCKAMRDAKRGRDVSTQSLPASFIRVMAKVIPHRVIIAIEEKIL